MYIYMYIYIPLDVIGTTGVVLCLPRGVMLIRAAPRFVALPPRGVKIRLKKKHIQKQGDALKAMCIYIYIYIHIYIER